MAISEIAWLGGDSLPGDGVDSAETMRTSGIRSSCFIFHLRVDENMSDLRLLCSIYS